MISIIFKTAAKEREEKAVSRGYSPATNDRNDKLNALAYNMGSKMSALQNSDSVDFVNSNITKLKKFAQRNVSKSYLTGCSWFLTAGTTDSILYTFRNNGDLLITTNGIVKKLEYEIFVDNNSILITKDGVMEHYTIVLVRDDFLFLNRLSSAKILTFANHTKFKDELKSVINDEIDRLFQRAEMSN